MKKLPTREEMKVALWKITRRNDDDNSYTKDEFFDDVRDLFLKPLREKFSDDQEGRIMHADITLSYEDFERLFGAKR